MPTNENANGAEPVAHEEEASAKRQTLKQIGLAAGALVVTALGASAASARDRNAQPDQPPQADQSPDAETRIVERALKDEKYRRRLIADPRDVIGEEVGRALPPGVHFKVLQETADTVYLVLPYIPAVARERISATDLQNGAVGLAFTRSWFRSCPCKCSSLSVCK